MARHLLILLLLGAFCSDAAAQQEAIARKNQGLYVAVLAVDLDTMATWYGRAFGLSRLDDTEAPDGRWRIVNLTGPDMWVELIRDSRSTEVDRPLGFRKVGLMVDDLDQLASRLSLQGITLPEIVISAQHDMRILQVRDPEGNLLQFMAPAS